MDDLPNPPHARGQFSSFGDVWPTLRVRTGPTSNRQFAVYMAASQNGSAVASLKMRGSYLGSSRCIQQAWDKKTCNYGSDRTDIIYRMCQIMGNYKSKTRDSVVNYVN